MSKKFEKIIENIIMTMTLMRALNYSHMKMEKNLNIGNGGENY